MARQTIVSEFNSFVGGLITEASPLTFPGNAALDINNFKIDKDGTISRRLGMDFETSNVVIDSGVSGEASINTSTWVNAGGDPKLSIAVIQIGNVIKFFDTTTATSVTGSLLHTHTFTVDVNVKLSMATVDGTLVVVGAAKEPSVFEYNAGVITESTYILRIRDVFGVEDVVDGVNLRSATNITVRPVAYHPDTQPHIYNLRNSTFAQPRIKESITNWSDGSIDPLSDTINAFRSEASGHLPSNSDSVTSALFADAAMPTDRLVERFWPKTIINSPIGNSESPRGYFVIDALERGTSRLQEIGELTAQVGDAIGFSSFPVTELPLDRTPGGATVVSEFAGRIWYAGFSGEVVDGDTYSPRMSSHLLFSQLVSSPTALGACHQVGDPTSREESDLLETDGGFIRIDEAFGIQSLINIGNTLIILAQNGVWAVSGGSDFGFTATTYKVTKVSNHGCANGDTAVLVDDSVLFWGDDGIYQVSGNEFGDLKAVNLTTTTIQSIYDGVSDIKKLSVKGFFDTYDRKVRWLFNNLAGSVEDTGELVLDVALSAFYLNTIPTVSATSPNVVAYIEVPPFKLGELIEDVTDGGIVVTDSAVDVTVTLEVAQEGLRELAYLTLLDTSPTLTYTVSRYSDTDFIDWLAFDSVGVDAPATLITGFNGAGDFQRYKQVPYISFHFEKTEDGFTTDELGDIFPTHESSCLVQAQWEWANSAVSGRWGREFQAYRHKRAFIPENAGDTFDNGFSVVTTKNKLRGKGRVLSLQLRTEPLKDCRLLGWSTMTGIAVAV